MIALIGLLGVAVLVGVRSHTTDRPVPYWIVLAASVLCVLALYSQRAV